jgi:hypothetical protein
MKRAMWSVDKTGDFRFSDGDNPEQSMMFSECYGQSWLAEELVTRLGGEMMTVARVKEFVLTQTPCYLFKGALKILELEDSPRLTVTKQPAGRESGNFPNESLESIEVRFQRDLFSLS